MNDVIDIKVFNENKIDPVRMTEWSVDHLVEKTTPYLQALLYVNNLSPEQLEYIYKTKLHILKTYSAIHNVAELYGSEDSVSSLKLASYNIKHFLSSAVEQILKMFDDYDIDIQFNCPDNCKSAVLDIRRTSLIMFNLISNSIIHTRNKSKQITISVALRGDELVMAVKDNGQGIAKSEQADIFSAYKKKLTAKMLDKTGGGLLLTGMGLAVARKSAVDMGGSLNYVPTGSGCLFELTIPQSLRLLSVHETIDYEPKAEDIELYLAGALLQFME